MKYGEPKLERTPRVENHWYERIEEDHNDERLGFRESMA